MADPGGGHPTLQGTPELWLNGARGAPVKF